jgi:hypothetical protein
MKIFICTIGSPEGELGSVAARSDIEKLRFPKSRRDFENIQLDTFGIRSGAEGTQLASYAG